MLSLVKNIIQGMTNQTEFGGARDSYTNTGSRQRLIKQRAGINCIRIHIQKGAIVFDRACSNNIVGDAVYVKFSLHGGKKVYINVNWYWFPVEPTQLHLNTSPLKCNVLAFMLKGRAKDPLVGTRENKMNIRELKASFCLHFFLHIALTTLILEC